MDYIIKEKEFCDVGGGFRVAVIEFEKDNETLFAIYNNESFLISKKHLDYTDYADFEIFSTSYKKPLSSVGEWIPLLKETIEYWIEESQQYFKHTHIYHGWLPDRFKQDLPGDYIDWIKNNDKFIEIKDDSVLLERSYLLEKIDMLSSKSDIYFNDNEDEFDFEP